MRSVVDRLLAEHTRVIGILDDHQEVSLRISTEATLRKVLVLSAASFFETCITDAVLDFVANVRGQSAGVVALVEHKAIRRQYYTYFQWGTKNANSFFAMFGTPFKRRMSQRVKEDAELAGGIEAFLAIGAERNKMVHEDFGSYSLDKTTEEVMDLYRRAIVFVEQIPVLLETCGPVEDD